MNEAMLFDVVMKAVDVNVLLMLKFKVLILKIYKIIDHVVEC